MERRTPTQADGSALTKGALLARWETAILLVVAVAVLFVRFVHPADMLGYYQDDFFYYLKVAENIASTGTSTFNGLALTNGYHPLWMATLVVLRWALHGTPFFFAVQTVSLIATMSTYLLFKKILGRVMGDVPARACAFALGLASLQLMRYGMEVTLTLPLAALVVWLLLRDGPPVVPAQGAWLGFLCSLLILSRLDAALLVVLLGLVCLPEIVRARKPVHVLGAVLCGLLPLVLLYLFLNEHVFHLLTPVSGLSKQMKTTLLPSAETWKSLIPDNRMKWIVVMPQLALLALGLVALLANRTKGNYPRRLSAAMMLFPLLHWSLLSVVSDWPLWAWYFYSLTVGCVGAFVMIAQSKMARPAGYAAWAYAMLLLLYSAAYVKQGPNSIAVLRSSAALAQFMDQHPGVWMIGDQAGTTGYLSKQPIVQMEGLVMDRTFLELMRKSTPLRDVVSDYHGDFYAVFGEPGSDGCMHLSEPTNAGPTSPRMRGVICSRPIATFSRGDAVLKVFPTSAIQ